MRYGIVVNAGEPREMADLAAEAEAAGWDGVFYYDAIAIGDMELYDPWVALAAMAMRTERVRLGLDRLGAGSPPAVEARPRSHDDRPTVRRATGLAGGPGYDG